MGLIKAFDTLFPSQGQTPAAPAVAQQPNDPFSLLRPQPVQTQAAQATTIQQPAQAVPALPQTNQHVDMLANIAKQLFGLPSSPQGGQSEISAPPINIPQLPQQPDMSGAPPDDANPQKRAAYIQALRNGGRI